jgi:hypothetical protein
LLTCGVGIHRPHTNAEQRVLVSVLCGRWLTDRRSCPLLVCLLLVVVVVWCSRVKDRLTSVVALEKGDNVQRFAYYVCYVSQDLRTLDWLKLR